MQLDEKIQSAIEQQMPEAVIQVSVSGNHSEILVVSDDFDGLRKVQRQQKVYQGLSELLASGELHAVNIKAMTQAEKQEQDDRGF